MNIKTLIGRIVSFLANLIILSIYHYAYSIEETFLRDFLVILKQMLQNSNNRVRITSKFVYIITQQNHSSIKKILFLGTFHSYTCTQEQFIHEHLKIKPSNLEILDNIE